MRRWCGRSFAVAAAASLLLTKTGSVRSGVLESVNEVGVPRKVHRTTHSQTPPGRLVGGHTVQRRERRVREERWVRGRVAP